MRILILMLLWPILEIAVFMAVGDEIGFFTAALLCLVAALFGGFLIQQQGLSTALTMQQALNRGEMPMATLFSGICLFLAGVLFIIPGFLSDIVAVFLLFPQIRLFLRGRAAHHFTPRNSGTGNPYHPDAGDIIDADFVEIKSEDLPPAPAPRLTRDDDTP